MKADQDRNFIGVLQSAGDGTHLRELADATRSGLVEVVELLRQQ